MKKLLISLSIIGLSVASISTTAFTFTSKYRSEFQKSIQKLITTTNISAEAQILSNPKSVENNENKIQSVKVNGIEKSTTSANINYEYLVNKLSSQKMVDFLPSSDWVKKLNSDKTWDRTLTMEQQLNKNYNVHWKTDAKVLNTTGIQLTDGKKTGASSTANTLSLVSSLMGIMFGSDFNVGQAQILYQNTNLIFDLLGDSLTLESLEKILTSIPEFPNEIKLEEYLGNPFKKYKNETVNDAMQNIGKKFWSILIPVKQNADEEVSGLNSTLEKIGSIINYVLSIVWYLQQFDTNSPVTSDSLSNVLNKKINENDIKSFDEINISKVLGLLKNFLKPGYGFQGARGLVNILFGIPTSSTNNELGSNIILSPLFKMMKERSETSETSSFFQPINSSLFKSISLLTSQQNTSINWIKIISDVLEWIDTPNSLPANIVASLKQTLNIVIELINSNKYKNTYDLIEFILGEALFKPLTDSTKKPVIIGDVLYVLATMKNSKLSSDKKIDLNGFSYISSISGVPNDLFVAIYNGGLFKSIFQLINAFKPDTIPTPIIEIAPDLKTIFGIKMDDIFKLMGLDLNENLQFLYGLRNMSLLNIIEQIDKYFKPKAGSLLENYYFDYGSLREIILSLFKKQEVLYNGEKKEYSNIQIIIKSLIASIENKEIKIGNQEVKEPKKALVVALGLKADGNSFVDGDSIFKTISKAYGHNLGPGIKDDPSKAENTVKLIAGLVDLSSWFVNVSETEYTSANFGDFFNQKNWHTKFISQNNYENIYNDSTIQYQLDYKMSRFKIYESYTVTLFREKTKPNVSYGDKSYKVSKISRN